MAHPGRSDPWYRLVRLNRTSVFLAALVVGLAGFFLPGVWGALVLYAVVGTLAWLLARTWAVTPPPLRVVRLIILTAFAVIATTKIT